MKHIFIYTLATVWLDGNLLINLTLKHKKSRLDFPGKCYDGERTYDVGTYYSKTQCVKMVCGKDFTMDFMA